MNIDKILMRRVVSAGELAFEPAGVALLTAREDVVTLARRTVAAGEIALRLSLTANVIPHYMSQFPHVRRCAVGWVREDFNRFLAARQIEPTSVNERAMG